VTVEFEELDFQETALGDISLRRRSEPAAGGRIIYEVKLGDEFLMSSLFTAAEIALAKQGLAAAGEAELDVIVGGLGLGYTAAAALELPSVRSLVVIEVMGPVIDWHRRGLVPLGGTLVSDPRCTLFKGDFFEIAASPTPGFSPSALSGPVHAVLLDIDHSPSHWLASGNSAFYTESALRNLAGKLHPGGVFGMWSNDPPDGEFSRLLESVFDSSRAHVVTFPNPYSGGESSSTVYISRTREA
jgi:spermidine synthase